MAYQHVVLSIIMIKSVNLLYLNRRELKFPLNLAEIFLLDSPIIIIIHISKFFLIDFVKSSTFIFWVPSTFKINLKQSISCRKYNRHITYGHLFNLLVLKILEQAVDFLNSISFLLEIHFGIQ